MLRFPQNAFMPLYPLYGKNILSAYPLPLQGVGDEISPDITVYFDGYVNKDADGSPSTTGRVWKKMGDGRLLEYYNRTGHNIRFLLSGDGSVIRISQSWPDWRDTLFALMNPAMAAALTLGGSTVLHASSLVWEGGSYLVMGVSGAGKSTLSAALATEGMSVHSDDITVLNKEFSDCMISGESADVSVIAAGYPRLKISPVLAEYLDIPASALLPVFVNPYDKPEYGVTTEAAGEPEKWVPADQLAGGFYPHPAPLKGIFILSERQKEGKAALVERLSPLSAAIALTGHYYGREWLRQANDSGLAVCSRLAQSIPVYRASMPDTLTRLQSSAKILFDEYIMGAIPPAPVYPIKLQKSAL